MECSVVLYLYKGYFCCSFTAPSCYFKLPKSSVQIFILQNGNFALSVSNFMKLVKRCTQLVCNYTFRLYERANAPLHLTYFSNKNVFCTHNFLAMALLIHLHVFKMHLFRKGNVFSWQGKYFLPSL